MTRALYTFGGALLAALGVIAVLSFAQHEKEVLLEGNSLTSAGEFAPSVIKTLSEDGWHVRNNAVGGATTPQRLEHLSPPAASQKSIAVLWEATNDILFGESAEGAYKNYRLWCEAARTLGYTVIAATILPRSALGTPANFEQQREKFNDLLRNGWPEFADALADVAADPRIGDRGSDKDPVYFSDLVHLTPAGAKIAADIVATTVTSIGE